MTGVSTRALLIGSQTIGVLYTEVHQREGKEMAIQSLEAAIGSASHILAGALGEAETVNVLRACAREITTSDKKAT